MRFWKFLHEQWRAHLGSVRFPRTSISIAVGILVGLVAALMMRRTEGSRE